MAIVQRTLICDKCGSTRIETGIAWGKSAEMGNVGLRYSSGFVVGVTQVSKRLMPGMRAYR